MFVLLRRQPICWVVAGIVLSGAAAIVTTRFLAFVGTRVRSLRDCTRQLVLTFNKVPNTFYRIFSKKRENIIRFRVFTPTALVILLFGFAIKNPCKTRIKVNQDLIIAFYWNKKLNLIKHSTVELSSPRVVTSVTMSNLKRPMEHGINIKAPKCHILLIDINQSIILIVKYKREFTVLSDYRGLWVNSICMYKFVSMFICSLVVILIRRFWQITCQIIVPVSIG